MLTLAKVNSNKHILEFIKKSEESLKAIGYTDHGLTHSQLVADRARTIAQELGLSKEEQEQAAISGFCHDMANFLSRPFHYYFGALLFYEVFKESVDIKELIPIMQAIALHDKEDEELSLLKEELELTNPVQAILVIADKSDVRRSRVTTSDMDKIKRDIHDRVNYATELSKLKLDKKNKQIILTLKIDTNFVPIMEYFEIFTRRMVYCRQAAEFLGYRFGLIINNFRLL